MKTYIKPDTEILDVRTRYNVFAGAYDLFGYSEVGAMHTVHSKSNNSDFEDEDEDGSLW